MIESINEEQLIELVSQKDDVIRVSAMMYSDKVLFNYSFVKAKYYNKGFQDTLTIMIDSITEDEKAKYFLGSLEIIIEAENKIRDIFPKAFIYCDDIQKI